jgi:hypothetical protein
MRILKTFLTRSFLDFNILLLSHGVGWFGILPYFWLVRFGKSRTRLYDSHFRSTLTEIGISGDFYGLVRKFSLKIRM